MLRLPEGRIVVRNFRCPATEGVFPIPPEGAPRARGLPGLRFQVSRSYWARIVRSLRSDGGHGDFRIRTLRSSAP